MLDRFGSIFLSGDSVFRSDQRVPELAGGLVGSTTQPEAREFSTFATTLGAQRREGGEGHTAFDCLGCSSWPLVASSFGVFNIFTEPAILSPGHSRHYHLMEISPLRRWPRSPMGHCFPTSSMQHPIGRVRSVGRELERCG